MQLDTGYYSIIQQTVKETKFLYHTSLYSSISILPHHHIVHFLKWMWKKFVFGLESGSVTTMR